LIVRKLIAWTGVEKTATATVKVRVRARARAKGMEARTNATAKRKGNTRYRIALISLWKENSW
jgi:hypothetical protein